MKAFYGFILLIFIAGCAQLSDNKPVVRVGNQAVKVAEFRRAYYKDMFDTGNKNVGEKSKKDFLQKKINITLQVKDACEMGFVQDSVLSAGIEKMTNNQLYKYMIEKLVTDNVITDKVYKNEYDYKYREIKARQIYIKKAKDDKEDQKNIQLLDSLRLELIKGAEFAKMARQYSQDAMSSGRGGNMGFINYKKRKYDESIYKILYKMKKGDISPVIETKTGLYLFQMLEERKKDVLPFELEKYYIQREFFRDQIALLNSAYEPIIRKLKDDYPLVPNDENINYFLETARATLDSLKKNKIVLNRQQTLDQFDVSRQLATVGGEDYTILDFINDIHFTFTQLNPALLEYDQVADVLENISDRRRVIIYAKEHKFDKDQEFRELLQIEKDKLLVAAWKKRVKESLSQKDLKAYYGDHWQDYNDANTTFVPYDSLIGRKKLNVINALTEIEINNLLEQLKEKYPVVEYQENLELI